MVATVLSGVMPAARVGTEIISDAEVDAELRGALGERPLAEGKHKELFKAALDQVIDRHLVMAYLTKTGQATGSQDVDLALAQFEKELKSQNLTLAEHCENVGRTMDDLRRGLAWKLSWKRYCEKYLTPENIEKYFERYRREFDGTQLRIAQLLLKTPSSDEAAIAAAKSRASALRQEIIDGKVAFADAAKRNSDAPSGEQGGDIGWIERHQPMPEDFSKAAFALNRGEVSPPLVTSFGVHLLTVLDEKPGQRSWRDAEAELRPAVTLYLFRWIADKERQTAKIEYLEAGK
jgi:parvulin-like peptidyl-prolyl isomerase